MKTPRLRIASTIASQTLKNGASKRYAQEVAAYLLAEGRVGELDSLLRDIREDWAKQGYVEVLAYSAHPLTAEIKADIAKRLRALYPTATSVVVTEVLDQSVIGGVQIRLANQQLDLSIEAKLNKFKQLTRAGKE